MCFFYPDISRSESPRFRDYIEFHLKAWFNQLATLFYFTHMKEVVSTFAFNKAESFFGKVFLNPTDRAYITCSF